ncbi:MAG: hypothetical protein QM820_54920 [Minicystis sp.]
MRIRLSPAPATLLLALALGSAGCELIAGADRDRIPDATGGSGGTGGATATSSSSSSGAGGAASCLFPADCPGSDTDCVVRTCDDGLCGAAPVAIYTPTTNQDAGDCQRSVCDGKGNEIAIADDTDVPVDLDPCTDDICSDGVPSNPPSGPGAPCNAAGGKVCDGQGACVECVASADCGAGLVCINNACSTCFDGKKDGTESDVDCGGTCAPCADGSKCNDASDCQSGVCSGLPKICQGSSTSTGTGGTGGTGGATSSGSSSGAGGMGGGSTTSSTSASSAAGSSSSSASSSSSSSSSSASSSSSSSSSSSASSSSSSGATTVGVVGVFLGGSVQPGNGSIQVRGQIVWHARVSEGSGSIKVNGWLQ